MSNEPRKTKVTHDIPMFRAATFAATLLATAGCATPQPDQPAAWKVEAVFNVSNAGGISEAHYSIGRRHDRARAWAMAVDSYRKAVSVDPHNVEAHNALGVALSRAGQHDEAVASLRLAVALDPGRAHLRSNLGNALFRAGRLPEAIGELKQALVRDARDPIAKANLRLAVAKSDPTAFAGGDAGADSSGTQTQAVGGSTPVALSAEVAADPFTTVVPVHPDTPTSGSMVTSVPVSMPLAMQVFDAPSVPSLEVPVTEARESLMVLAGQASPPLPPTSTPLPAMALELYPPTFSASAPPRIEIANGNGVVGMAARLGAFLRANGLVDRAMLSNVLPFNISTTVVHYRAGFRDAAEQIVARAPFRMELAAEAGGAVNADIRVVLGRDVRAAGPCTGACEKTLKVIAADDAAGPKTASASSDDSFAAAEGFGG